MVKILNITFSYNQHCFIESNDSINAFNIKIIMQHCPIHPNDHYPPRSNYFYYR